MNVLEFTAAVHNELQNLLFPRFDIVGKIGVAGLLGMLDYNIGLLASSHADTAKQFNLIDAQGNVNLDCAECMVRSLPFPITYGVISISKEDAERVISNIKAGEGKK